MLALLRDARVVDDPGADRRRLFYFAQHKSPHRAKQRCLLPWRLGYKMMQRLMLGADFLRRKARRYRLDAFRDAPVQALRRQNAEFGLCHIQPASIFGHIVPFEAPHKRSGFGGGRLRKAKPWRAC